MALRLTLENEQTLPDGGPVFFQVTGKRSVDIGRDRHLDWTLPDPSRMISSKHCEVHYREGGYWLHDVSTNGTFLNGADQRMREPHRLRNGDRFIVGHYIIGVSLDASDDVGAPESSRAIQSGPFVQQHADYREIWSANRDTPPPIDPKQLRIPREAARPVNPEFLDWAAAVPEADVDRSRPSPYRPSRPVADQSDMSWASGSVAMPPPAPPLPLAPSPRRPVWTDDDASWGDDPATARQPPPIAPSRPEPPPLHSSPPRRSPEPASAAVPAQGGSAEGAAFARQLARAAGLPEEFFVNRDATELAEQLGVVLRITVENVMSLLQARSQAKQLTRSSSQTVIQAIENNPLKFSPTPEDAMRIMFGPRTQSYLDARGAFVQGFDDLKSHQLKTYMAMQHAVAQLVGSIDPVALAREMEAEGGFRLGSGKGKLWDAFMTRWKAQLGRDSNAPIDAFTLHFADYYDRGGKSGSD